MTLSAMPAPAQPDSLGGRIRWTVADGLTLVGREMTKLRNEPGELLGAILFPAIMVLLFGYIFGSAIKVPGGGNYREYLMPGLFAMTTFTSVVAVTLIVATDATKGVMDRFRSMPMARSAVPFGHTGADILIGVVGVGVMAVTGLLVGWQPHRGVLPTAGGFALLFLMRYALSWTGVYFGLVVKNDQMADRLMPLIFPVTMISNSFVPTSGMPAWLRFIAEWNPVSAVTAACRDLFGNPGAPDGHGAWPLTHPVAASLLWTVVLLVVFVPLSIRTYQRKGR